MGFPFATDHAPSCSAEIVQYSDRDETAVCNLASIALPRFLRAGARWSEERIDYAALRATVRLAVTNLDRVIDANLYPTQGAASSNGKHRPVGLGVQGLADVYMELGREGVAFDSAEAREANRRIFAHIYYAAVERSAELAAERGAYPSFPGSPASQGLLQPDLWGVEPLQDPDLNWDELREKAKGGLRNSLLIAVMPTASTASILGNCECIEPQMSNIYSRRTTAGDFTLVNSRLQRQMRDRGLWTQAVRNAILRKGGSVQGIAPPDLAPIYKTSWEISQAHLIDQASDRGAYVCQSQSMNLFLQSPSYSQVTSMLFYSWECGLKTGMYYLRSSAAAQQIQFNLQKSEQKVQEVLACRRDDPACVACSA